MSEWLFEARSARDETQTLFRPVPQWKWACLAACPAGQRVGHTEQGVIKQNTILKQNIIQKQLGGSYITSLRFGTNSSAEIGWLPLLE